MRHVFARLWIGFACALVWPAVALSGDGGFATGDLWLRVATQTGTPFGALVRVDALSGGTQIVLPFSAWHGNAEVYEAFCYDPNRDRILVYGTLSPPPFFISKTRVWAVDGKGNATETPFAGIALAPSVDGKLYAALNFTPILNYYDTSDVVHPLLNAAGTAPFYPYTLGFAPAIASLIYDAPTHSLLYAVGNAGSQCAPITGAGMSAIYRLNLSPDGSRVLSQSCVTFDIDGALFGAIGGYPMGFSRLPDGKYLLVVRGVGPTGTPDSFADRMLIVDPDSLATAVFASNGGYTEADFTNAGTFSRVRNQAVIFDPNANQLRAFSLGSSGVGTDLAVGAVGSVLDPSGFPIAVERAAMVEIGPFEIQNHLSSSKTSVSIATGGTQALQLNFGAQYAGAPYFVVGSTHGAVPGFVVNGKLVPLAMDNYFQYTLVNPNNGVLAPSLGLLNGTGQATCNVTIPAGLAPSYIGLIAHHAAVVLSPALTVLEASDAVSLRLVP